MNIFALDMCPIEAAKFHCDQHLNSQIKEAAQMLSTLATELTGETSGLYKPTHKSHPCVAWLRESFANCIWLSDLAENLNMERKYRFDRDSHASIDIVQEAIYHLGYCAFNKKCLTPFAQAMPAYLKSYDPVGSYREYYKREKDNIKKGATWTLRPVPFFMIWK